MKLNEKYLTYIMNLNFSQRIRDVLTYSKEEAERLGNRFISPEHMMLGLMRLSVAMQMVLFPTNVQKTYEHA